MSRTGSFMVTTGSLEAGAYSVRVHGTLGVDETRLLERTFTELLREGASTIVVDFNALEVLGSGLASVLDRVHRRVGWRNGRLSVVGASPTVMHDLELCGLDELLAHLPAS